MSVSSCRHYVEVHAVTLALDFGVIIPDGIISFPFWVIFPVGNIPTLEWTSSLGRVFTTIGIEPANQYNHWSVIADGDNHVLTIPRAIGCEVRAYLERTTRPPNIA